MWGRPGGRPGAERIEELLAAAQRQIAEYARAAAAEAEAEAEKIKSAAESYAASLRTKAEFERASARAENEREAAKARAAGERERENIVRAARREADEIRRREQFLLEQSEALRTQAEADLDVELADRRSRGAAAGGRAAGRGAGGHPQPGRRGRAARGRRGEARRRGRHAGRAGPPGRRGRRQEEIADAHRKAELVIAQAKDEGKQVLADIEADADKRRAVLQKELDELTRQKAEIDEQLAQMRKVFAVSAFLDTPAS